MPISTLPVRSGVTLEQLVRPFVGVNPTLLQRGVSPVGGTHSTGAPTTEGDAVPTLSWSASMSPATIDLPSVGFTVDLSGQDGPDVFQNEDSRQTHVERVFNEEDDSQFVDVELVDKIDFTNDSGLTRKFSLNNGA